MVRIALVHDWLDRRIGGAERVLLELARLYPDAPVYTLLHDGAIYNDRLDPARVRPSWLQSLPHWARRRPRYLLPLIPSAVERWDLSGFDVVLSSSVAFVKNVLTPPTTVHICYCHAPMRFAWDYWPRYLDDMEAGPLKRRAVAAMVSRLRAWDLAGCDRVDRWLCNSETTRLRLRRYYSVDARVIHPPVQVEPPPPAPRRQGYVTLGTLTEYKRIDLAVQAFARNGRRLTVIGDGPDRARLERLAQGRVEFAGHVDDPSRLRLLAGARALIFPSEEDFGIAPVEALACGTPVIAYRRGGLTETIEEGATGVFFDEQTEPALTAAVAAFEQMRFDPAGLQDAARRFSVERFVDAVASEVEAAVAGGGSRVAADQGRVTVAGIGFDPLKVSEAVDRIAGRAADRSAAAAYVVKPYVEFLDLAARDPGFREVLNGAWLCLADGVAVQWAASLRAGPRRGALGLLRSLVGIVTDPTSVCDVLPERVAGLTLTVPLLERCSQDGLSVFLVGTPKQQSIEAVAAHLRRASPGLRITGTASGRGGQTAQQSLLAQLELTSPDLILVGMGFPRQERLVAWLAPRLRHGVLIGEGGSFDYREFGGAIARAPELVRRWGLEWLWRLGREPSRLRRQLAIPRFIWHTWTSTRRP